MTRKDYSMIPVLAAIVMIPQVLFWWLAPVAAAARFTVYIGGTILTVGIPVAYLVTYWYSNLRKAAGLSVVCCILETAVVVISALLLGIDVSVRSAVFAFIITTLICMIVLLPLISATLRKQRQGIYSAGISVEPSNQPIHNDQNRSDDTADEQIHNTISRHMPHQISVSKPLPPRNR